MTQAITNISVDVLKVHPRNTEFFDDISGEEYERFRKSIEDDGLLSPLIVAPDMTVISGHQRLKACKDLGYKSVPVIIKDDLEDEDEKLKKLIAANFGRLKNDPIKQARVYQEYEKLSGVGGKGRPKKLGDNLPITQDQIAKELGMTTRQLRDIKSLLTLVPDLQDMISDGAITATTGYKLLTKLSEEDQLALLEKLPAAQKFTQAQVQQYIDQIEGLEREKQELQVEAVDAVKLARGAARASEDSAEYMRMKEELEQAEEDKRKYYEKWNEERKKDRGISSDDVQTEIEAAVQKTKEEYRRLIDSLQRQIDMAQDAEPEVVEVEVVPEDYEEIKAELERLKQESREAYQTDFSKQFKRTAVENENPEDILLGYEQRLMNETGSFLSIARGWEVRFDLCSKISKVSKALIRKNIEQFQQILTKMDAAIMGGETECKSA